MESRLALLFFVSTIKSSCLGKGATLGLAINEQMYCFWSIGVFFVFVFLHVSSYYGVFVDWNQAYLTLAALLWLFNTVNSQYRVWRPGQQPSLSQFRGSLVDSLVVWVSLWKWSCFGADVHRNLRYSPGVVFWVTGCKGQRGANGTANLKVPLWSLFVRCWQ